MWILLHSHPSFFKKKKARRLHLRQQQQQQQLPQQHDDDKKSDNSESVDVIIPTSRATQSQKDELQQYIGMRIAKEFMTRLSFDTDTEETHANQRR
mmetsp:Transcript_17327/g.19579  ORF Transcript_17327/g.19579 Transcript_17327/m.19579 type:complete len:96 (+) Transcript_17327:292-579(+)